jgi:hypothetical protein
VWPRDAHGGMGAVAGAAENFAASWRGKRFRKPLLYPLSYGGSRGR